MSTSASAFDENISTWMAEQKQPWMALRYNLEQAHIERHVGQGSRRILDAGGGNGRQAIAFARQGHRVTVVDFSVQMLAQGRHSAGRSDLLDRVDFRHADLMAIPDLFPDQSFDLVLCHNVLQYVDDVGATLRAICHALRPGGLVSLVTVNGYSEVLKAAIRQDDLDGALEQVGADRTVATLFGVPMRRFTDEQLLEHLRGAGCQPLARYGVRCLCDWLPNDRKSDAEYMAQLEELELALAGRYPYYLMARYFQIMARKAPE